MQAHKPLQRSRLSLLAAALAGIALPASGMFLIGNGDVARPAPAQFGLGPRTSLKQLYIVTLQPREPLQLRKLLTVPVAITDSTGRPVMGARFSVDGGMPEHRHGLPTQPRLGRALGAGLYEIEGLRFSMGGWWELTLAIESPAGADQITFNLDL